MSSKTLVDALNENVEKLIEQVGLANQYRFGRRTETMEFIEGQLTFFDEADALYNPLVQEPDAEEVIYCPGQRNFLQNAENRAADIC